MIELVLPLPTPSVNRLHGYHWSRKAKLRKQWAWLVRAERLRLARRPIPEGTDLILWGFIDSDPPKARQLALDRYGPRMLDHDNFVAGAKQLIDALVAEGFLVDDSPAHMTATYRQHVGKPYRTVVTIDDDAAKSLNSV